jgi:hypothetical protein
MLHIDGQRARQGRENLDEPLHVQTNNNVPHNKYRTASTDIKLPPPLFTNISNVQMTAQETFISAFPYR